MKWALDDPTRFLRERSELDRLEKEVDWLTIAWGLDNQFAVEVDIDLKIHDRTFEGTLTYPDLFPQTPAYIRPRDPSERWTVHQYGEGGSLCLEWRADNWDQRVTGADLVRSAYKLLHTETNPAAPAAVPSAHRLTAGQTARGDSYRLVCTPGLLAGLDSLDRSAKAQLRTQTLFHRKVIVAFVSKIGGSEDALHDVADLPAGISSYSPLFSWKEDGLAFKNDSFDQRSAISSVDDLRIVMREAGFQDVPIFISEPGSQIYKDQLVLLIGSNPRSLRAFAIKSGEKPTLREYSVILPDEPSRRLPDEHTALATLRIGIVGLGSLGSKIAVSLARSGITKFLLVDDDLLLPGNLRRHELSWSSVGMHKVDAVQEALSLIAPEIDVDVRTHRVAGQESALAAAAALNDLAACDILIDATANADVFLRLAAIAKTNRRALCWGELYAGGFGGMIARARPGIDPNPFAVRAAVLAHYDTLPEAPFRQAEGYDGNAEEPLIAYDGEVGQIASALTMLVLDTALRRNPSSFPFSAYMVGLRMEWVFTQPFDTQPIEVSGEGWDTDPLATAENRTKVIKDLLEIFVARQHADA